MIKSLKQGVLAIMIATTSMTAMAYDDADRAQLEAYMVKANEGFDNGNVMPFLDNALPPKIFVAGLTISSTDWTQEELEEEAIDLRHVMMGAIKSGMESLPYDIQEIQIDFDNIEVYQTKSGMEYLLIPTMMFAINEDETEMLLSKEIMLGVKDNGKWYMAGGSADKMQHQGAINSIKRAYPEIEHLDKIQQQIEILQYAGNLNDLTN